jgi:predicted nuclease of predicted toxin-antitoxin system
MTALAFDEDFNNDVVRGLLRRKPALDVVRVQDAGLTSLDDPAVLAWAAAEGRVLVSHDVQSQPQRRARGARAPAVPTMLRSPPHSRQIALVAPPG